MKFVVGVLVKNIFSHRSLGIILLVEEATWERTAIYIMRLHRAALLAL